MGLFNFLHKPEGKNIEEEIKKINTLPPIITVYRRDGTETLVYNFKVAQRFRHRDGSISCLITAEAVNYRTGDTMFYDSGEPICFEVPEGRMDLIQDLIERNTGMMLNKSSYTYVGRAFEKGDTRLQPPSAAINNEIEKLNRERLEAITNERLSRVKQYEKEQEARKKQDAIQRESIDQMIKRHEELLRKELQSRLEHPSIRGGQDDLDGEFYDGVNLSNGEILKIRNTRKIAKDATGRYVYTARIQSSPRKDDTELQLPDIGVPVVFSLPFRMNDIVNSQYDEKYKEQLERGILHMLSVGYEKNINKDGTWNESELHDIGGIDKSGQTILNNRENVGIPVISKIKELQRKYAEKNAKGRDGQSHEDR